MWQKLHCSNIHKKRKALKMTTTQGVKKTLITVLLAITSFFTKAQLSANFTSIPVMGCAPLLVSFTVNQPARPHNGNGI
jgi:hypothetical protein